MEDTRRPVLRRANTIEIPDGRLRLPLRRQHSLRHTFATRCIESGIPPVVLKTWLGHKDIHVTLDTYTDVFREKDHGAVEKLDKYIEAMLTVDNSSQEKH